MSDPAVEAAQRAWDYPFPGTAGEAIALSAAREALKPIRELHQRRTIMCLAPNCGAEICDHDGDCPVDYPVDVCAACWQIVDLANAYYGEDGINAELLWPCTTAKLVYTSEELGRG